MGAFFLDGEELAAHFAPLAKTLGENEQKVIAELKAVQGKPVDLGGYYLAEREKFDRIMRPSATFNQTLKTVGKEVAEVA